MLELNRFVVYVHACKWKDIGLELGLEFDVLSEMEVNSNHDNKYCFRRALNMWLKETQYPSWSKLEVAITNVNRTESGLLPVVSVYGKDLIRYIQYTAWSTYKYKICIYCHEAMELSSFVLYCMDKFHRQLLIQDV